MLSSALGDVLLKCWHVFLVSLTPVAAKWLPQQRLCMCSFHHHSLLGFKVL